MNIKYMTNYQNSYRVGDTDQLLLHRELANNIAFEIVVAG